MVADAQRNVIISLKLAADPQNQAIADQVARQAEYVATAGVIAAKKNEDVFVRIEAGNTQSHSDESNKRTDKDLKEYKKRKKSAEKLAKKIKQAEALRTSSHQKANEAGLGAVQGLAEMAEGAAKLGLVGEESFQKFAKGYEVVQSGIQVFKGATDMFLKGREALVALSTATHAQTAANNLMSTSNLRLATTNALAGASGAAAGKGGGPVTGGVGKLVGNAATGAAGVGAGKAAAGGAGTLASAKAVGASAVHGGKVLGVLAAELASAAAAGLALTEGVQAIRRSLGDTSDSAESTTMAIIGWWNASKDTAESTKKLTQSQKEHMVLLEAQRRYEVQGKARSGFQKELRTAGNRINEARATVAGESSYQSADRQRLDALREVRAAEAAIAEDRKIQNERVSKGQFASQENELRLLKESESAQSNLLNAELNRLSVIRDQNKAVQGQLDTAREKLAVEREGVAGRNAQFGKLSKYAQTRALKIAERKQAGGKLDERDIRFLERKGLVKEYTEQYRTQAGVAAGGNQFQAKFGQLDKQTQAQGTVAELSSQHQAGQSKESVMKGLVVPEAEALKKMTEDRIKLEAELKGVLLETIQGLKAGPDNAGNAIRQAAADASDAINQQGMVTIDSIKTMQDAMLKSHEDMQKQLEKFQLNQNWNKQA